MRPGVPLYGLAGELQDAFRVELRSGGQARQAFVVRRARELPGEAADARLVVEAREQVDDELLALSMRLEPGHHLLHYRTQVKLLWLEAKLIHVQPRGTQ